jgi:hypothetical protein
MQFANQSQSIRELWLTNRIGPQTYSEVRFSIFDFFKAPSSKIGIDGSRAPSSACINTNTDLIWQIRQQATGMECVLLGQLR